jgi:hypothetical protein
MISCDQERLAMTLVRSSGVLTVAAIGGAGARAEGHE